MPKRKFVRSAPAILVALLLSLGLLAACGSSDDDETAGTDDDTTATTKDSAGDDSSADCDAAVEAYYEKFFEETGIDPENPSATVDPGKVATATQKLLPEAQAAVEACGNDPQAYADASKQWLEEKGYNIPGLTP